MGCYNLRLETWFSAISPGSSSAGVTELSASRPPSMGDRLGVPPQSHSRFLWKTNPGATTPERPFRWHLPPTPDGSVPALAPEEASMFPDERPCRWRRYHTNGPSSRLCGGALGLARMSTPRRLGSQKTEKQPLTAEASRRIVTGYIAHHEQLYVAVLQGSEIEVEGSVYFVHAANDVRSVEVNIGHSRCGVTWTLTPSSAVNAYNPRCHRLVLKNHFLRQYLSPSRMVRIKFAIRRS
ncbi:hypothetical protein HPB50_019269 [Hyalomma asiaticum]|uniref:Uncharacterized protein n=1 Tax=Hyalomma asiaticum TaxID=266040 RepID=A0ACB7SRA6_HYAAI|nr:hypothetical protein HPB50_019269 [Hyalomma asiaticum]